MIGARLGVGHHFSGGFDSSASAFFAATGITGATEQQAVNTLVTSLKSAGLWSKMKAVYPFVTDNRNLLSYTEDFGNAYWNKFQITVTTNTTTAPNGTTTADTIQNTGSGYVATSNAALLSTTYTQSCYFKKNNNNWVAIYTSDGGSNYAIAYFNINTGVVGTASAVGNFSNASSSISSVGNGWYRCVLTFTKPSSGASDTSNIIPDADNTFNRTAGQNVYAWGAQLELGSTATTYQPIATTQQSYISNQFKYNLVNPVDSDAAFRLVFNGGWTMSNQGALPNGTNGYADTKLNAFSNLSKANAHLSFYSRTQYSGNSGWNIGAEQNPNNFNLTTYFVAVSRKIFLAGAYPVNAAEVNDNTTLGLHIGSAQSTTSYKLYKNASLVATNTTLNTTAMANYNIFIGGANANGNPSGYLPHQCAFSSIGDGLSDSEATALYNAVQTFNTTLSRQV